MTNTDVIEANLIILNCDSTKCDDTRSSSSWFIQWICQMCFYYNYRPDPDVCTGTGTSGLTLGLLNYKGGGSLLTDHGILPW